MAQNGFAWRPYGPYLNSRAHRFMKRRGIATWREFVEKSRENITWFWNEALTNLGIEWFRSYHTLYWDWYSGMPWTLWFRGGETNVVYNCLDRHIRDGRGKKVALYVETDDGVSRRMTYKELHRAVNRLARALLHTGIKKGDRVATCMRTSTEAAVVMFAAMKIGAICMQPSPRFPADKMVACLNAAEPKLIFMHDGYVRGGKTVSLKTMHCAIRERVPSLKEIVVVRRIGNGLASEEKSVSWNKFLERGRGKRFPDTTPLDPETPALILYSSGTTGTPKTIVHSHAGVLTQPVKELGYYFDCMEDDVFFWATDVGWMMWPWEVVGALFFGASVLLYEGTALYPTHERMFQLIDKYKVTTFGFTPPAMKELVALGAESSHYDLSSLRFLGSTGSRIDPKTWIWFFETFGLGLLPIINITGGTDILGCFCMSSAMEPQKAGSIGCQALGMDVDVVDDEGNPVRGKPGNLICRKPAPSMTRGFWRDEERYIETYFPRGPHMWIQGDIALIDEGGYWDLIGRADDVINRNGIKIDPEEVDSKIIALDSEPKIVDAVTVGASDPMLEQKVVCFVVIGPTNEIFLQEVFITDTKDRIKEILEKGWGPDEIHIVSAIPRNQASKTPRKIISAAYEGAHTAPDDENARLLEEIRKIGEDNRA